MARAVFLHLNSIVKRAKCLCDQGSRGWSETQIYPEFLVYSAGIVSQNPDRNMPQLIDTATAANQFSLSISTLKKLRLGRNNIQPALIEGAHWMRLTGKKVLFNSELMGDFFANQSNPTAHARAIDLYLRSLPSSQP